MVIALIGESCTGKSSAAEYIKEKLNAEVYSGKDYLRLAKNRDEAKRLFSAMLYKAGGKEPNIIYVIAEKEDLTLLPEKAFKVLFEASIETIKARFSERMNGNMPPPVAAMLERKHGMFGGVSCDMTVKSDSEEAGVIADKILKRIKSTETML